MVSKKVEKIAKERGSAINLKESVVCSVSYREVKKGGCDVLITLDTKKELIQFKDHCDNVPPDDVLVCNLMRKAINKAGC